MEDNTNHAIEKNKEEDAIVLDFLKNGYPSDTRPSHQKTPIAQAIGIKYFTIIELVPKKEKFLELHEDVYIGSEEREKIHHISSKIPLSRLTQTAKTEVEYVIGELIENNKDRFIEFFNNAQPINTRIHQLELLPGIGRNHTREIVEKRDEKPFKSFEDIKTRVKLMPDPKKVITKRIFIELNNEDKHKLFVQR